jgi:hypothetical protein
MWWLPHACVCAACVQVSCTVYILKFSQGRLDEKWRTYPRVAPQVIFAGSMANLSLVERIKVHHFALLLKSLLEVVFQPLRHTLSCENAICLFSRGCMLSRYLFLSPQFASKKVSERHAFDFVLSSKGNSRQTHFLVQVGRKTYVDGSSLSTAFRSNTASA